MCFVECFIEEALLWTAGPYTMSERDPVQIDLQTSLLPDSTFLTNEEAASVNY